MGENEIFVGTVNLFLEYGIGTDEPSPQSEGSIFKIAPSQE
jgi:hypothetical protein